MTDRVNRGHGFPVDGSNHCQPKAPSSRAWLPLRAKVWPPWRPRCLGCGERGENGRDLCPACAAALPRIRLACVTCGLPPRGIRAGIAEPSRTTESTEACCDACRRSPPPLTRVVAPLLYAPPLDRWLPRFKFHHDLAAGRLLSQLMLEACAAAPRPDAIVPVPLHRARLRSRGYDQALELAKPIARALSLPLQTNLLLRIRATSAQSTLHAEARHHNLKGAFLPLATNSPLPAHIALVDDVMTTGATLHSAANELLRSGASRVDAWVCARAP